MRRNYTVSLKAVHRQEVLARTCAVALRFNVAIVDVRIPPAWDEERPAEFSILVQAHGEDAIHRFCQGVDRLIDVIEVVSEECLGVAPGLDRRDPRLVSEMTVSLSSR